MISYDKYQNRIKKIAAVKNFIVRFRWPFIALFAVLIAASLALMFTKGMITQSIILPDKIIYGDDYGSEIQRPKAFLSDVEYQFKRVKDESDAKSAVKYSLTDDEAAEEDEWTYELPTYAGKYLVRMVSNKIFGKSYSAPAEFEIETKPIDFVIKSDSVIYGEMPKAYDFDTVKGDSFDKDAVRFNYENPAADSTIVWADKDSFRIYNSKGEDVTFCYDISVPKTEEEVKIETKDETLTPESLVTEYIGRAIDYDNGVVHLKGGDAYIETKIYKSGDKSKTEIKPVDAGFYTVEITDVKVYNGEVNVTNHYNFTSFTATIKVDRRPVTITTQSAEKEYDGTPLKTTSVDSEGLIEGHTLETSWTADAINAGTYPNKCVTQIFAQEEEVTSNYAINYVFGTLEVTRRKVTLTTYDDKKVYDGTPYFNLDSSYYSIENLVSGHTPKVEFVNYSSDAGSYPNKAELIIKNGTADVTRNYDIRYNFGTLTISKRKIQITTPDGDFTYNGTAQSNDVVTDSDIVLLSDLGGNEEAIADGEWYRVIDSTKITYFTTDVVKNEVVIEIRNKYGVTTKNYDIEYVTGTLSITPYPITVYKRDISRPYNGEELSGEDTDIFDGLLYAGDRAVGDTVTKIIDVKDGTVPNGTTYKIVNSSGQDITKSYAINYKGSATLTVLQAELTIYTPYVEKFYDGTPLSGSDERYGTPTFIGLAAGDGYRAYGATELIDAGSTENKTRYTFYAVRNGAEVSTTGNYRIVGTVEGYVTVNPRPVCIVTANDIREYDGTPLSNETGWCDDSTGYGLLSGHRLVVDGNNYASITDVNYENGIVAGIPNEILFKVFEGERDVSGNYNLADYHKYGTLTVTPRIVLVKTAGFRVTYDAQAHSDNSTTCLHGSGTTKENFIEDGKEAFVSGHILKITTASFIKADEHENAFITYTLEGGDSYNYYFIWDYGTIIIDKRPIEITTASGSKTYDDTPFTITAPESYEKYVAGGADSGLLPIHRIEHDSSKFSRTVTYVTERKVENEQYYRIFGDAGEVTGNYKITIHRGKIWIEARELTFETASESKEFDGTQYSNTNYTLSGRDGLVSGHNIKFTNWPSVTFVNEGEVENAPKYSIVRDNTDVTENYAVTPKYGKISRTVRYVQITTNSRSWTYDGKPHSETGYTSVHLHNGTPDGAAGLVLGHELVADTDFSIATVENYTGQEVENRVTYRFKDANAGANYNLSVTYGTLSIKQRKIIITVDGARKVYDGTPLSNPDGWHVAGEYDVDNKPLEWGLVEGHTLKVLSYPSITEVEQSGTLNDAKYEVVLENGVEKVNNNYKIVGYSYGLYDGELIILTRSIEIITATVEAEYDGKAHSSSEFTFEEFKKAEERGLLEWHEVKLAPNQNFKSVTNVPEGKVGNVFSVEIFDKDRKVTQNYKIEYKYGTLSVTPRIVRVTTGSLECPYDGKEHSRLYEECVHGSFVNGQFIPDGEAAFVLNHRLDRLTATVKIDAGEYDNVIEYRVLDAGNNPVTSNYKLDVVHGKIVITKLKLTIVTATLEKVYDATPLRGDDKSGKYGAPAEITGLAEGDYEVAVFVDTITDVGAKINGTQYDIYRKTDSGSVLATQNYDLISYPGGTLTVTHRVIWVVSGSAEKEYDGEMLSKLDGWTITGKFDVKNNPLETGLVARHTLKAVEYTYITDVQRDNSGRVIGVSNVVSFIVVDYDDAGADVNGNYIIEYLNKDGEEAYGTLTITPRAITVRTATDSRQYDGTPLSNTKDAFTVRGRLVAGHSLYVKEGVFVTSVTEVHEGSVPNIIGEYSVCSIHGDVRYDVTGNYDVKIDDVYGMLTILPREVTIVLNTVEDFEYGDEFTGYPEVNNGLFMFSYADGSKHIVDGEKLIITVKYQFGGKDIDVYGKLVVGEYTVVLNSKEMDGGRLDNYDITVETSTFEVLKRKITIYLLAPEDGKKEYDGTELVFDGTINKGYELAADSTLAYRDELTIAVRYLLKGGYIDGSPLNAGEYTIELDAAECEVSDGAEEPVITQADSSYEITAYTANYVITRRPLIFGIKNIHHEYMGEFNYTFSDEDAMVFDYSQLADIDYLSAVNATADANAVAVGIYDYYVTGFEIQRVGGEIATDNYYLSENQPRATLEIVEREIEVSVWFNGTNSREFTGEEIDLIEAYRSYGQEYGPFKSAPVNDGVGIYGIYAGDYKKIQAIFTASQDGSAVDLIKLGDYDISVILEDKDDYDVLRNYKITYVDGEFSITRRQIVVNPKMTAEEQLVYNGEKLNSAYLDYDTKHYFSNSDGLLDESHRDYFKATYIVYNRTLGREVSPDDVLQAGNYSLKVRLEYITENDDEKLYEIVEYDDSFSFTVSKRQIFVGTPDDTTAYVYNKTAAKTPAQYTVYYFDGAWEQAAGVSYIDKDFSGAAPVFKYAKENGRTYASAVDAGDYEIVVYEFAGGNTKYITDNYMIMPFAGGLNNGEIKIKPADVIVIPDDYDVDYTGEQEILNYPNNRALIKYVENNPMCRLFDGDELSYVVKASVNIRKISYTYVTFNSVSVREKSSGRDVTSNYNIAYTYTLLKKICPDKVSDFESDQFRAIMRFNRIPLTVKQPEVPFKNPNVPGVDPAIPDGYFRKILYGTTFTIPSGWITLPEENIEKGKLLTDYGHHVVPADSIVTALQAKDVGKWLSVKVLDDEGKDISQGYSITIDYSDPDTHIKLEQRKLVIEVDYAPSRYEEGKPIPAEDYKITDGALIQSATIEVRVEGGKFVAHMENKLYGDVTYGYSVEYAYPGTENYKKEAEYASRIQLLLSRRTEIIRKDDLS